MNWLHGQCIVATRNSNELLSIFVQSSNVTHYVTQTAHGFDGCFLLDKYGF